MLLHNFCSSWTFNFRTDWPYTLYSMWMELMMVRADTTDAEFIENADGSLPTLTEESDSEPRYGDVLWHLLLFTSNKIPHVSSCHKTGYITYISQLICLISLIEMSKPCSPQSCQISQQADIMCPCPLAMWAIKLTQHKKRQNTHFKKMIMLFVSQKKFCYYLSTV